MWAVPQNTFLTKKKGPKTSINVYCALTNNVYEGMKVRDLNEKGQCKVLLKEQLRMEYIREDGDRI